MSAATLPLRDRAGAVVAEAIVDADLVNELGQYRWFLVEGYPASYLATGSYRRTGPRGPKVGGANRQVLLHRHIAGLQPGDRRQVDHRNLNRLDNRRANLRVCTDGQNQQNVRAIGGTSRYRGVSWDRVRAKWRAYAQLNGRYIHLGYFHSEDDAAAAAAEFRASHMPFSREAQEVGTT